MSQSNKVEVAFKGANYQEDCGIYLELTDKDVPQWYYPAARLYSVGVAIKIPLSKVESIRDYLQGKLGHKVRIFLRDQQTT